ncbi:MAG: FeoB small GTPase domain-containing protein, partial [Novosphingobium sp.]
MTDAITLVDRPNEEGDDAAASGAATPRVAALVGNPNAGKSALFNALTGARQKIANYPGVTVERKAGRLPLPATGQDGASTIELVDLPGSYALHASSPDEEVTRRVIMGEQPGQAKPDVLVVVLDASNLEQHLVFAQEIIALGRPTVVALNMVDLAERDGLVIDPTALESALGVPVIATVAVRRRGLDALTRAMADAQAQSRLRASVLQPHVGMAERRMLAHEIGRAAILSETSRHRLHARMDRVLLHPWLGPVILFAALFVVFQAVFSWAKPLADALGAGAALLADGVRAGLPAGLLRDFLTDGAIAGVGAVV